MLDRPVKLSKKLTIGPAPKAEQLVKLSEEGYKAVVNLCTNKELDQYMTPEQEASAVEELGMTYAHLPLSISRVKIEDALQFCNLVADLPTPAYVHCRLGQRAAPFSLILHAKRTGLDSAAILEKAKRLGIEWNAPFLTTFIENFLERTARPQPS